MPRQPSLFPPDPAPGPMWRVEELAEIAAQVWPEPAGSRLKASMRHCHDVLMILAGGRPSADVTEEQKAAVRLAVEKRWPGRAKP